MGNLKMILLDAGHGGIIDGSYVTPGKRSPLWDDGTQYFEGHGNREIRGELIKLLNKEGIRFKEISEGRKDTPLANRVSDINAYARKYGPGNCLMISIHSDAFHKESANGWSCFTTKGETNSDKYAEALYEEIEKMFPHRKIRSDNSDGDKDKEEQFYIIRKSICPAILSENFFMTNESECKEILMQRQGKKKIALAHFNMIKRFV